MVLQFKVWRISWEQSGKIDPETGKRKPVLVLRDKRGRVKVRAKNAIEQARLTKWYERYNQKERLESLLESRKLKETVRLAKRRIRARGFKFQMSFYGITINAKTKKRQYRRYEIFKAYPWKPDEVAFMYDYLKAHVPLSKAGLFVFHNGSLFVDPKDELTKFGRDKPSRVA